MEVVHEDKFVVEDAKKEEDRADVENKISNAVAILAHEITSNTTEEKQENEVSSTSPPKMSRWKWLKMKSLDKLKRQKKLKDADDDEEDSPRKRSLSQSAEELARDDESEHDREETEKQRKKWWEKWGSYIKYSIVSKETEEAFREVWNVLHLFFKDMNIGVMDATMCLMLLSTYHTCMTGIIRTEIPVNDTLLIKRLHHCMLHACSAYGWKLVYGYSWRKKTKGFLEGIKNKKNSANIKILMELTGIKEEDIVLTKWRSGHFAPGHFIVIDHAEKAVILTIRGTFHAKDCLTDLVANYEPFLGGCAHAGILMAARQLYQDLCPVLIELLSKNPTYELRVIGHSLGAGTATLFTMMLQQDHKIPVHCYAFAPPAIVSLDVAKQFNNTITSVVLNDDIVPRLSFGSLEDLKHVITHLLSQTDSNTARLFQFLSAGNNLGQSLTKRLSTYFHCDPKPDLGTKNIVLSPRLYPAGTVYHIFNSENKNGLNVKYNKIEESDPSLFGDIVISHSMFMDHMPDAYENALLNLVENEQQQEAV